MKQETVKRGRLLFMVVSLAFIAVSTTSAQEKKPVKTSPAPVNIKESTDEIVARMKAAKPEIMKRHTDLLNESYDLSNRSAKKQPCRAENPCRKA